MCADADFRAVLCSAPWPDRRILHGTGLVQAVLPWWIGSAAVVVLGAVVGSRFANTSPRLIVSYLGAAFGSFAVSLSVATVFVLIVAHFFPFPIANVVVAFSPGAQDTMMVLALALHLDPVYVGAHHVARFLVVTFTVAIAARRIVKNKKRTASSRPPLREGHRRIKQKLGEGSGRRLPNRVCYKVRVPSPAGERANRLSVIYSAASARSLNGSPSFCQTSTSASASVVDQAVVVIGARRDAQPLRAFRHRRIVDRLDVDAVLGKQEIARLLAQLGIADEDRHDVGRAGHHRQRRSGEHRLGARGAILMAVALPL